MCELDFKVHQRLLSCLAFLIYGSLTKCLIYVNLNFALELLLNIVVWTLGFMSILGANIVKLSYAASSFNLFLNIKVCIMEVGLFNSRS